MKPDYYAVHSATGMHVGLWQDKGIAEKVIREDYPNGTLTPLYKEYQIETLQDEIFNLKNIELPCCFHDAYMTGHKDGVNGDYSALEFVTIPSTGETSE